MNCGLWALSAELERFGLRSSSESERLMGSVGGAVVRLSLLVMVAVVGGAGVVGRLLAVVGLMNLFPEMLGVEGLSTDPQDGIGGRFKLGEVRAIFLFACCCDCCEGVEKGVVHSGDDCCGEPGLALNGV